MSISAVTIVTPRQREALDWLRSVGKASERLVRRHGFAVRTMDALADRGLIDCTYMSRTLGGNFKVYRYAPGCPRCGESTDGQPGYAGCTDPSCPVA